VAAREVAASGADEWDEELDEAPTAPDVDAAAAAAVPAVVAPGAEGDADADAAPVVTLPFSRKRAAFQCLRQAIKFSYDSWRLWYNYMVVSMDVGELSEACRALERMVRMRIAKDGENAVDVEVLEKLVDAVTRGHDDDGTTAQGSDAPVNPNFGKGLYRPVAHLLEQTILPKVNDSPRIFRAQARLALWQGDYAAALDAHLRAYRAAVATDSRVEHDRDRFRDAAEQVEGVVSMLENYGDKERKDGAGLVAPDWKFQARSIVRTFLGRTKGAFEDEPEYERLKELVKELR